MASRRRIRRRACEGKVRHRKREFALIALYRGGSDYAGCHAYRCPFCGGWHLGHVKGCMNRQRPYSGRRP